MKTIFSNMSSMFINELGHISVTLEKGIDLCDTELASEELEGTRRLDEESSCELDLGE